MNGIEQPLLIKMYLLGDLDDQEREAFEEKCFADETLFEEVLAAETDLIDAYVRGEIGGAERDKFEEQFLKSPERRERVKVARLLADHISKGESEASFQAVFGADREARGRVAEASTVPQDWPLPIPQNQPAAIVPDERQAAADSELSQAHGEWKVKWKTFLAFLKVTYPVPRTALAAAALWPLLVGFLVVIVHGTWILVKNRQLAREINQMRASQSEKSGHVGDGGQGPRKPTSQQASSGSEKKPETGPGKASESHDLNVEVAEVRPPSLPPASILLTPGMFRGIGPENLPGETRSLHIGETGQTRLIIRPGVSKVQLRLEFDHSDYSLYSVTLETDDQNETWQKRELTSERTRDGHWIVRLNAPADLFKTGDYVVELKGTAAGAPDQERRGLQL